jgi:hypothetical protein
MDMWPLTGADKILNEETMPVPGDPKEENYMMSVGASPVVSPLENFQEHIAIHTGYLNELMQRPEPDEKVMTAVKLHLMKTQQTQQAIQQEMMRQTLAAQTQQQPPVSESQTGVKRGRGAGGPAANGPIRPRQFHSETASQAHGLSRVGRPAPGGMQ